MPSVLPRTSLPRNFFFSHLPALVDAPDNLDVRAAFYDAARKQLRMRLQPGRDGPGPVRLVFGNVWGRGDWTLRLDGVAVASGDAAQAHAPGQVSAWREEDTFCVEVELRGTLALDLEWN